MALARDFTVKNSLPNTIVLNWTQPLGFNNTDDELIITRTTNHFPVELFNSAFPTKATDSRPIEIFRGKVIVGSSTSVVGEILEDTAANFPNLAGRLLRDSSSKVHKIISNTTTEITLETEPTTGKYVILADFPTTNRRSQDFYEDLRTTAGIGFLKDPIIFKDGILQPAVFEEDELANLIFFDGTTRFIIKSNTSNTIYFWEDLEPVIGPSMQVYESFKNSNTLPYVDKFRTEQNAQSRILTSLEDNTFYYYTVFTKEIDTNVAQAEFGLINSKISTQNYALSVTDKKFGDILYNLWPNLMRELDQTEDLKDLMSVFGFQLNELHALIDTYNLQDVDNVLVTALLPLSEQTGLPTIGFSIGTDTLRRIGNDIMSAWKLKGSKEGIALFIKIITTWDITNGTADYSAAIEDFLPNAEALRFYSPNLGSTNIRITESGNLIDAVHPNDPSLTGEYIPGGRFARSLPGIVIPGFFTFREYVINIPNVALYVGNSELFTISDNKTTMLVTDNNFGEDNSLVGNFLIPNQEEINDIFEIISNTQTTITVKGIINNTTPQGYYGILSPLNTKRFIILTKLLPEYQPFGTRAGIIFTDE